MIRRKLSEIKTLAKLEPTTGVFLVEGRLDRNVIRDFVRNERSDWAVYDCNIIDNDLFREIGSNYREVLCQFAEELNKAGIQNALCIIDADFDIMLGFIEDIENLTKTDFTTLLLYGLNENTVRAIGRVTGVFLEDTEFDCIILVARTLFYLKLRKNIAQLNHKMPTVERVIRFEESRVRIDFGEYERLLSILSSSSDVWRAGIAPIIESMPDAPDFRFAVNDHDIALLISLVLKRKANKNVMSSDGVLEAMAANIDPKAEPLYPLFQSIRDKIRNQPSTIPVAPPHPAPVPPA